MKINLGAGSRGRKGYVNLDVEDQTGIDVVHDLEIVPWPFKDGEASEIIAWDVYEHVFNWKGFMAECHRILEPEGILYIHTAYWKNESSFNDPDHKRFLTELSFDYWVPGTLYYAGYGKAYGGHAHPFAKVEVRLDPDLLVVLRKLVPECER